MVSFPFVFLVPLFIYPSNNAWAGLYTAITNHPTLNFSIILNPDCGPGSNPPNTDYISGISKLHTFSNVQVYGYVLTNWATRSTSLVDADVHQYSSWGTYTRQNIGLDGIFFDQVPTGTDARSLSYMQNVTAYARKASSIGHTIWFNTGATTPPNYYSIADYVNAFEGPNSYSANGSNTATNSIPQGLRSKSAATIYGYHGSNTQLATDANSLVNSGLYGLWITDMHDFSAFPTFMQQLVGDVCGALGCGGTRRSSL